MNTAEIKDNRLTNF